MPVKSERDVLENIGEQLSLLPPNTGYTADCRFMKYSSIRW